MENFHCDQNSVLRCCWWRWCRCCASSHCARKLVERSDMDMGRGEAACQPAFCSSLLRLWFELVRLARLSRNCEQLSVVTTVAISLCPLFSLEAGTRVGYLSLGNQSGLLFHRDCSTKTSVVNR